MDQGFPHRQYGRLNVRWARHRFVGRPNHGHDLYHWEYLRAMQYVAELHGLGIEEPAQELYRWLIRHWESGPTTKDELQAKIDEINREIFGP